MREQNLILICFWLNTSLRFVQSFEMGNCLCLQLISKFWVVEKCAVLICTSSPGQKWSCQRDKLRFPNTASSTILSFTFKQNIKMILQKSIFNLSGDEVWYMSFWSSQNIKWNNPNHLKYLNMLMKYGSNRTIQSIGRSFYYYSI